MTEGTPTETLALVEKVTRVERDRSGWALYGTLTEVDLEGVSSPIPVVVLIPSSSGAQGWTDLVSRVECRRLDRLFEEEKR
jgi:hypothetical protein